MACLLWSLSLCINFKWPTYGELKLFNEYQMQDSYTDIQKYGRE